MASKKIFIDSTVLYSFVDRADRNHVSASKTLEQFSIQGISLFTSYLAIQETYTAIGRQLGVSLALDFLQSITESSIEVLYPQKADLNSAFRLIKLNKEKRISLKEAMNAVLMQRRGIQSIMTFTYWHSLLGSQIYSGMKI